MEIVKINNNSHWYTTKGEPVHEVEMTSKKGVRPTNVSDARKFGFLPSVTNILNVIAKPQLEAWKVEQGILSALTLPRRDGESLQDFAHRAAEDSITQAKEAADIGTQIHAVCDTWTKSGKMTEDSKLIPYLQAFIEMLNEIEAKIVWAERILVGPDYAGTADLMLLIKGEYVIADIKTQDVKIDSKGNKKYSVYDGWDSQLAAYSRASEEHPTRMASIIIDRSEPKAYYHEWDDESYMKGMIVFDASKTIWKIRKNYDPLIVRRIS